MPKDDPAAFAPPPAFGPFRVLHQIGIGALGPVFRTYEPTRDRLVAVKVFRLDITPEQAQVLADELSRAADAGLFHPSIVEPIAAGVEGTVAYRAEEYVAAESLDIAIRHYAPATLDKALPFLTQLAGAIDFARTAGVGHGALHLRDVFVTPDEARASGFGVVEALERVGLRAPVRRPYSAPERIAGSGWSTPADVFSLGAIAYELLTGRRPSGTGDQIGALTDEDVGDHAKSIRASLARAMHDDPARRYPTALAFASGLEAAARGRHVTDAAATMAVTAAAPVAVTAGRAAAPVEEVDEPVEEEPDILAERDEDAAHHNLLREEIEEEPDPTLFDDEAVTDLALDAPDTSAEFNLAERDRSSSAAFSSASWQNDRDAVSARSAADSGELPSYRHVERPGASGSMPPSINAEAHGTVILERPRPAMLPMALTLILGLLLGFAAGYAAGGRGSVRDFQAAVTPASPPAAPPASPRPETSAAQPQRSGRAWSEQVVAQPPVTPPPVPGDEPPTGSARSSSPSSSSRGAVAGTGQMIVRSNPPRAGVTVNGDWRGRTPLTLSGLKFGSYSVRVVQPGFATAREDVKLSAAEPSRALSFRLQRAVGPARPPAAQAGAPPALVGSIYVDSRPRGARVVIDGRVLGTTPARIPDVPIGSHVVRLELPDHRVWTTSTSVAAGKEASVTGSLDRIR
jgi:serine/threonine protein kinase